MRRRLRVSFAARLLVAGLAMVAVILVALTAFLLVSRDREVRGAALSNADDRAKVLSALISQQTANTGLGVARQIADAPALQTALAGTQPAVDVPRLFIAGTLTPPGHYLAVLNTSGRLLESALPRTLPEPDGNLPSVRSALTAAGGAAYGVELLGGARGLVSVDSAARVVGTGGVPIGIVIDVAPLVDQLAIFGPVIGSTDNYRIGFIPRGNTAQLIRLSISGGGASTQATGVPGATSPELQAALAAGGTIDAIYSAPTAAGVVTDVAGSFVPVADAERNPVGYVGVEAPVSLFSGDTRSAALSVGLIAIFFIVGTAALVLLFVDRFVRRPVARLERGVARIAGGDYTADVPVTSSDELGRLAGAVNVMRRQIQENVAEIEGSRARLDAAVEGLSGVSRALTTTTRGVSALQDAVVRAAVAIAGPQTAAALLHRDGDRLVPSASIGIEGEALLDAWGVVDELVAGRAVRVDRAPAGWQAGGLVAVPMFYQDQVVGALAVITGAGSGTLESDAQALAVLANNAAVALENTRLFEQERETVRRLRELDGMKSDFLATVQHELRTPLTAIMGMSDLLEMCWPMWEEQQKLDALADIQMASKNLYDIVETIIDFSLLERDTLGLHAGPVPVRASVEAAVEGVASRLKGGLPVEVEVDVATEVLVFADPERFRQVVRALVDNAVKFTHAGGRVKVSSSPAADSMVRIDIVDTGIGIPVQALPRIFERFYQVDNSATRAYGGTGMGLALVQRLVLAHGARVEVDSAEGAGSRFTLYWPATGEAAGGELAGAR